MCKFCWVLVAIFGISTSALAYKFVLTGDVIKSEDGRLAVQLTIDERDLVLGEMRTFLESVQQITLGVATNDFAAASAAARQVGRAAQQDMPGTLVGKLPLEFKKMGFDTHAKFTQLALDAEQLEDSEHTMNQLAELLENCTACHSIFKFEVAGTQ